MLKERSKHPGGRPVLYRPEFCEKVIELAKKGAFVPEVCMELGIRSKDTFYRWVKEYPEFGDAFETYKLYSQAYYEKQGRLMMNGDVKGNQSVWHGFMNNRFSEDYKRVHTETNININQINNIQQLSMEEIDKRIHELQRRNPDLIENKIIEGECYTIKEELNAIKKKKEED